MSKSLSSSSPSSSSFSVAPPLPPAGPDAGVLHHQSPDLGPGFVPHTHDSLYPPEHVLITSVTLSDVRRPLSAHELFEIDEDGEARRETEPGVSGRSEAVEEVVTRTSRRDLTALPSSSSRKRTGSGGVDESTITLEEVFKEKSKGRSGLGSKKTEEFEVRLAAYLSADTKDHTAVLEVEKQVKDGEDETKDVQGFVQMLAGEEPELHGPIGSCVCRDGRKSSVDKRAALYQHQTSSCDRHDSIFNREEESPEETYHNPDRFTRRMTEGIVGPWTWNGDAVQRDMMLQPPLESHELDRRTGLLPGLMYLLCGKCGCPIC